VAADEEVAGRIESIVADEEEIDMEPADVESDGCSFSSAPIGPYKLGKAKESVIVNEELAQKFGLEAIGTTVCREFGTDGVFYGIITGVHVQKGEEVLYQVEYSDGDVEDIDLQEYNYVYALWLKEEGWNGDEYEPNEKGEAPTTKRMPPQKKPMTQVKRPLKKPKLRKERLR
jgi:hypothetical protein